MSQTYHFIGIGGIGMSGLARILLNRKASVSGSDIAVNYTIDGLVKEGASIHKGHSADLIKPNMTVVYSSDIKPDNPEYLAAIKMQCALLHRSDLLAQLTEGHRSFAVAGTHGKTTTSALLSTVFVEAGVDPSFAVGGMLNEFHANSRFGQGPDFILEADESDRTFLKYHPFGAIVTNIDNDHLINYQGSEEILVQAFKQFMSQVVSPAHLFWCGEDNYLKQLNMPGKRYGFGKECDWRVFNIRQEGFKLVFDVEGEGRLYSQVELACIGQYNALNALAVFGTAISVGIDEQSIRRAFKGFKGVMRRCEKKGELGGVTFIDDYAHHPTEICVTLKALQQAVKGRRLVAVFQAHRYSRTKDCLGMYGKIFEAADELIITDVFAAGETPIPNVTHAEILAEVQANSSVPVQYIPRTSLSSMLAQFVQPHDVVVTLGAGDVTKVGPETLTYLEKQPPKRMKLGLVFGGTFTEHEVSIRSADHFRNSLRNDYYQIENFGITKKGNWIAGSDAKQKLEMILEGKAQDTSPTISSHVLEKLAECDVIVPVLHGPGGEDGMIQGFFDVIGKAYVGCDHRASAICMDKITSKKLALYHQIRTSPFVECSLYQWQNHKEQILKEIKTKLTLPVFVKPTHLGSTVGVTKVNNFAELEKVIDQAFCFDNIILIENGIVNPREIEFAVLGNEEVQTFAPGEVLTGGAVYDYNAKYARDGMKTDSCAKIPASVVEEGKLLAIKIYRILGCSGLARVDFFLDGLGAYWFNEVNPLPGFTSISLYPKICEHNGLSASELMDRFIILALHRKRKQDRINHTTSLVLKNGHG